MVTVVLPIKRLRTSLLFCLIAKPGVWSVQKGLVLALRKATKQRHYFHAFFLGLSNCAAVFLCFVVARVYSQRLSLTE